MTIVPRADYSREYAIVVKMEVVDTMFVGWLYVYNIRFMEVQVEGVGAGEA